MELYFLRHGLAVSLDPASFAKDSERPLTSEGRRKLAEVARAMVAMELAFDLVLSSPYVRARQTAEIVAAAVHCRKQLQLCPALEPAGEIRTLIRSVKASGARAVLLVGHEPYLSELISLLVAGKAGFPVTMKKGGLCRLSVGSLRLDACATLEWLLTPRQMRLIR